MIPMLAPLKSDKHSFSEPVASLIPKFAFWAAADKTAEAKASRLGWAMGITIVLFLLSLFVVFPTLAGRGLVSLVWAYLAACLAACIALGVARSRWKSYDLDDRKLGTIRRFLEFIAIDSSKTAPIRLTVDFRAYAEGGVKEPAQGTPPSGTTVKRYSHEWFTASGDLVDGTRYTVGILERIVRKEKPKRKYTKVRESVRAYVCLTVRLGKERKASPKAAAAALEAIAPPAPLALVRASPTDRGLAVELGAPRGLSSQGRYGAEVKADPASIVDGDTLLKALAWVYDAMARAEQAAS